MYFLKLQKWFSQEQWEIFTNFHSFVNFFFEKNILWKEKRFSLFCCLINMNDRQQEY